MAGVESQGQLTRRLAEFVVQSRWANVPSDARHETVRALLHWVGCATGGCRHESVERALRATQALRAPGEVHLFGRVEQVNAMHAAFLNGLSSHVLDFDDTQLGVTNIHPSGPVAAALFALAELQRVSGETLLHALLLGIEVECRIANAVYARGNRGWHVTGAVGMFGAAAACGKVLGLDTRRMAWALGIAATQVVGLREMFGSMCKSLHVGRSAENGLLAATLAAEEFTSGNAPLEGEHGFARVVADAPDLERMLAGLGARYEISRLSYKPFACGIVIHPTIDACLQLRRERGLAADEIEQIRLRVHPDVLTATGKWEPHTGLEGKFSVYHAAAVAVIEGIGGEAAFSDQRVTDPRVTALRKHVSAEADPSIRKDEVRVTVLLKSGTMLEKHVEHAIGSVERPLSDGDLEDKFRGLAKEILDPAQVDRLLGLCWNLEGRADAGELARAAAVGLKARGLASAVTGPSIRAQDV